MSNTRVPFPTGFALSCVEVVGHDIYSEEDYRDRWLAECQAHGETKRGKQTRLTKRTRRRIVPLRRR